MKKLFLCLCAALLSGMAAAQDLIVKHNGDELQAKVVEIGDTQIKYRKFANPEGPVYSVASSDVFFIRFENGTKELISAAAASAPAAADPRYSHVAQAIAEAKAPLRDKHLMWGVRGDFGYSYVASTLDGAPTGLTYGAGVTLDWFPSLTKISALGLRLGMQAYNLTDDSSDDALNRYDLNLDICWVVRGKSLGMRLGPRIGIPLSSKLGDLDASSISKTNFGLMGEITWSPGRFDLGAGYAYSFTDSFDLGSESSTLNSIFLTVGYRF